jgi:hypothetical protein
MRHTRSHKALPVDAIVALHAEANHSDPFAAKRMALILERGQDNADAVLADARRMLAAKHARMEETDKAWRKSEARKEIVKRLGRKH